MMRSLSIQIRKHKQMYWVSNANVCLWCNVWLGHNEFMVHKNLVQLCLFYQRLYI